MHNSKATTYVVKLSNDIMDDVINTEEEDDDMLEDDDDELHNKINTSTKKVAATSKKTTTTKKEAATTSKKTTATKKETTAKTKKTAATKKETAAKTKKEAAATSKKTAAKTKKEPKINNILENINETLNKLNEKIELQDTIENKVENKDDLRIYYAFRYFFGIKDTSINYYVALSFKEQYEINKFILSDELYKIKFNIMYNNISYTFEYNDENQFHTTTDPQLKIILLDYVKFGICLLNKYDKKYEIVSENPHITNVNSIINDLLQKITLNMYETNNINLNLTEYKLKINIPTYKISLLNINKLPEYNELLFDYECIDIDNGYIFELCIVSSLESEKSIIPSELNITNEIIDTYDNDSLYNGNSLYNKETLYNDNTSYNDNIYKEQQDETLNTKPKVISESHGEIDELFNNKKIKLNKLYSIKKINKSTPFLGIVNSNLKLKTTFNDFSEEFIKQHINPDSVSIFAAVEMCINLYNFIKSDDIYLMSRARLVESFINPALYNAFNKFNDYKIYLFGYLNSSIISMNNDYTTYLKILFPKWTFYDFKRLTLYNNNEPMISNIKNEFFNYVTNMMPINNNLISGILGYDNKYISFVMHYSGNIYYICDPCGTDILNANVISLKSFDHWCSYINCIFPKTKYNIVLFNP